MSAQAWRLVMILGGAALLTFVLSKACSGGVAEPAAKGAAADAGDDAPRRSTRKGKKIEASDVPVVVKSPWRARAGETFVRERSLFDYAQSPEEIARIEKERADAAEAARKAAAEEAAIREEMNKRQQEEAAKRAEAARLEAERQARWLAEHPPKPVPPTFSYEYIGVIGPKDDAYAILRGPDQKLTYAKAGDIVDRRFRIERVAKLVLDLTYTDPQFTGEIGQVQRTFEGAGAGSSPRK